MDHTRIDLELLQQHIDSLPLLFRESLEWLNENPIQWDLKCGTHDAAEQILNIAIEMLVVLGRTSRGASVCIISEDHREIFRRCLAVCIEGQRELDSVLAELTQEERDLMEEACEFLIPGELNLLERTLSLPEPHQAVFIAVFFDGMDPKEIATQLGDGFTVGRVEALFTEAVHMMGEDIVDE